MLTGTLLFSSVFPVTFCLTLNLKCQLKDERHNNDVKASIRSKLTGHLANENDLKAATEILFDKSESSFVYMVSMVADFQGDKKWTIAELEDRPKGLDGMYREYFLRILKPKQEEVTYNVDKVS